MAETMPVCDVLSEATEYLTKLGTNIRIRSENLREKRIRKDKLRNTHAIHKAVDKVLLICELSKKSIENVETGVKNLLVQMEKAGATFGPGPKTRENSESGMKFQYFTYKSRRLRIRNKISLDHYTSVKVVSTSLSLSIIDKYPVYHDCKLYRLRSRKNRASTSDCNSSTIQHLEEITNSCVDDAINSKDKAVTESDLTDIATKLTMIKNVIEDQVENNGIDNESINSDNKVTSHDQLSGTDIKQSYSVELHSTKGIEDKSDCEAKPTKKKHRVKRFKHIKVINSTSSSDDEKSSDKVNKCNINSIDCNIEKIDIDAAEKGTHVTTLQSSDTLKPQIKCVSLSKLLKPDRVKDLQVEDLRVPKKSKMDTLPKKREVATKAGGSNIKRKQRYSKSEPRKEIEIETNIIDISDTFDKSNEECAYWTHKRKEVENFKSKKFNIRVTKLPEITPSFLEKHSLKIVTQMGLIVCKVSNYRSKNKSDDEKLNEYEHKSTKMKTDGISGSKYVDINKVKSSLLYDSDSDNYESSQDHRETNRNSFLAEPANTKELNLDEAHGTKSFCENDGEKAQKSYSETICNKSKDSAINAFECNITDNMTETTKEVILNASQCNTSRQKETNDCKKQEVTDKDILCKINPETSISSEKVQICETVESTLDIEPKFKNVNKQKPYSHSKGVTETDQNMQDKNTSDARTVAHVKMVNNNCSDKSCEGSQRELLTVNNKDQNIHVENSCFDDDNMKDMSQIGKDSCIMKQSVLGHSKLAPDNEDTQGNDNDKVKNLLLGDSDSEPQNEMEHKNSNTHKDALLADSDNDSQIVEKGQEPVNIITNNLLPNEVDCDEGSVNTEQDKINFLQDADCDIGNQENTEVAEEKKMTTLNPATSKDTEIVKSSLLADSSDDVSSTKSLLRNKRKMHIQHSACRSKRKHIKESMYSKKMLLTYSSSSDTEDEQLRNTLKEIKDYLLKGISSDDDGNKSMEDSFGKDSEGVGEGSLSKDISLESESDEDKKIEFIESDHDSDTQDNNSQQSKSGSLTENSIKSKVGCSSATPDGSCSQSSDIQDTHDKDIDGLTNLKSLKKTYRRRKSNRSKFRRRCTMAKASGLISNEGFLEAESSSDVASLSGSDHGDNVDLEDMPRVKLTDINGDGIGHLAKDDLLGESDTSVSHDDKKSYKKEEDTDEDNVKSKRRKAIAISSDSEAGSSRKKDNNLRLSDFEDSEDESSEPVKNKRKKKVTDSDASGGSSDDGKKKRRRIKTLDESDVSGSDTENEGRNKHGRKNIRKVMSKNQLEEATKKAAREEKERIARIAERQKLYNNLEFDESGKPDEVVLEKVILDFDPETKEPLIQVDRGLVKKLKPHQANGIKFMWDACFESVKRIKKDKGSGCILAHCMGLGKTLQVVSLTHTLLTHGSLTGVNRVLVVCPLSTVLNWVNEFRMWLKHAEADYEVDVYELSKFKQNSERAFQLSQWFEHGGVCVLGYEMFRNLSADKGKKFKKKILKNFQESLVDPGPDLVVCDEGHLLKNEKTSLSQSMNRVKTRRRIVLTGTPLQNNLKEYYCMVQFVKPNLLGKYNEYLNRFVNPITNGQYTDSTEHDIRVMKRRSHVLHKMLDGAVQRRDYGVLAPFLPPKHEYVLFITLTDVQIKLYHHYLDNYSRQPQPGKSSGFLFPDFQSLQRIWTHPLVLKYNSERYEIMQQKKREREEEDSEGSLVDFIDDDSTPDESSTEESSDDLSDVSDDSRKKSKKKKSGKKGKGKDNKASSRRGTRANPIDLDEVEPIESLEVKSENPTEWWMKLVSEDELEDMRNSHKLILLFDILRQCEAIGDKLLVFSQSLYSLDLIEHFLGKVDEATQAGRVDEKLGGHVGSWSPGVDYFRLDGSTSCENRSIWCKNFNRIDNQRARLFLISTRAGGLGINLVAANRVVIFDVSWNPSHDVQSIFRVYRFGQKKPCYVYRFLAMGTMEEKIYERQVTKQAISKRVIDEQQIDRHYAENDLAELYKFEPQPPVPRPLPPLPKDRLFAEMLKEHEAQIYKYHEHDSLLENKEEETLSEEERRAAWEDFENEKTRPPPQPFLSPYAMHNGMVQGLLAQQQQMAMATISAMLRKDMPNITDQQLRETMPLILASNPGMFGGYDYGLMQKMSEIYKYAQPGMMNPGMMNPMNAGGAMSGGSGMGASALHYEPPWQRQQQQQQQLRLQQLMQHQNSMGAKYYAGGLGSRDPMAMALQQQRARELMHRPRARGRPTLASAAPRPPPAHAGANNAGDVVNLDSD